MPNAFCGEKLTQHQPEGCGGSISGWLSFNRVKEAAKRSDD